MWVKEPKGLLEYTNRALIIYDSIASKLVISKYLTEYFYKNLEAIQLNPLGQLDMAFTDTNTRYGYQSSIIGLVSEFISMVNQQDAFPSEAIVIAEDRRSQVDTIDYRCGQNSFQVKTVRLLRNQLITIPPNLNSIQTTMVSLVDIDNRDNFMIPVENISQVREYITRDELQNISTHVYDNFKLY